MSLTTPGKETADPTIVDAINAFSDRIELLSAVKQGLLRQKDELADQLRKAKDSERNMGAALEKRSEECARLLEIDGNRLQQILELRAALKDTKASEGKSGPTSTRSRSTTAPNSKRNLRLCWIRSRH